MNKYNYDFFLLHTGKIPFEIDSLNNEAKFRATMSTMYMKA